MNTHIGIDVSKGKIDVAWLRDLTTLKVKTKVIENSKKGFAELREWIIKEIKQPIETCHCIMEATGIYHEPLAYVAVKRRFTPLDFLERQRPSGTDPYVRY